MGITSMYPKSWLTDVIVLRSGGRDAKGNPQPTEEIPVSRCLIGPRGSSEPVDRSEVVNGNVVLYRDSDPNFTFLHSDRIRIPEGARMAGEWAVEGRPSEWPFGVEVGLVRG